MPPLGELVAKPFRQNGPMRSHAPQRRKDHVVGYGVDSAARNQIRNVLGTPFGSVPPREVEELADGIGSGTVHTRMKLGEQSVPNSIRILARNGVPAVHRLKRDSLLFNELLKP